jgi:hypothetical protein
MASWSNETELTLELRLERGIHVRHDTALRSLVVKAVFPAFEVAQRTIDLDYIAM